MRKFNRVIKLDQQGKMRYRYCDKTPSEIGPFSIADSPSVSLIIVHSSGG